MTALTVAKERTEKEGKLISLKMAAQKIFKGSHVMFNASGYAAKSVATNVLYGVGFAYETIDNSAGSAGDKEIDVSIDPKLQRLDGFTGLTQADAGKPCYASDDNTFTLTVANNIPVGRIATVESATVAWVYVVPFEKSGTV